MGGRSGVEDLPGKLGHQPIPCYLLTYIPTQLTHPPTHLPTYLPTHLPTYPPTHPPTYPPAHLPTYLPTSILNPSVTDSFRHVTQLAFFLSFRTPPPPPQNPRFPARLTVYPSSAARRDFFSARSQLGTLSSPAVLYIYISCWRERERGFQGLDRG